jgi:hypothetical protein
MEVELIYRNRNLIRIQKSLKSSVANPDPGSGAFLPQGSGSGIRDPGWFFLPDPGSGIPDPYDVPNSIYLQDFTFKNDQKQEKFCLKYDFNYDLINYSCMKKIILFSLLLFVGSGSGIKDGRIRIRDKHPGSATLLKSQIRIQKTDVLQISLYVSSTDFSTGNRTVKWSN